MAVRHAGPSSVLRDFLASSNPDNASQRGIKSKMRQKFIYIPDGDQRTEYLKCKVEIDMGSSAKEQRKRKTVIGGGT